MRDCAGNILAGSGKPGFLNEIFLVSGLDPPTPTPLPVEGGGHVSIS